MEDGDGLRWWQRIELATGNDAKDARRASSEIPGSAPSGSAMICISRLQIIRADPCPKPVGKQQGEPAFGRSGAAHP